MHQTITKLPYDSLLSFGVEANLTATGDSANILDLKNNDVFQRFTLVTDISAFDRTSSNETISIELEYSNDSGMSGAVVKDTYVVPVATEATGRFTSSVTNEISGVKYRYCQVRYVLAGTTPICALESYLSMDSSL